MVYQNRMTNFQNLRDIDFYSGIGGWSLGLKSAGVDVVASYEWWKEAAETHHANLNGCTNITNIRTLDLAELPRDIDIVVGSPPCTQFSYSNRGGSGDIKDGLVDIKKFLSIVDFLKPKFWAMENVPRTAKILESELDGGELSDFSELFADAHIEIFNAEEFGLPQRRKRCIAGNFDLKLLRQYAARASGRSLGDVVRAFSEAEINDPNYNITMGNNALSEHTKEVPFSDEEIRINRSAKIYHPVYNDMQFPDDFERSARTVTATCTRVSRESIVIHDPCKPGTYRRLTVREKASLQGFPINFQFRGKSNSSKNKMVGNAIPPVLTYYIAQSFMGKSAETLTLHNELEFEFLDKVEKGAFTEPDTSGKSYPRGRSFRFAIQGLRFKSGMRFELNNSDQSDQFKCSFFFGDSTRIQNIEPTREIADHFTTLLLSSRPDLFAELDAVVTQKTLRVNHLELQQTWTRKAKMLHPFFVLDSLGETAKSLEEMFQHWQISEFEQCVDYLVNRFDIRSGQRKLQRYAMKVAIGMIVTGRYNEINSQGSTPIKIKGTGGKIRPCLNIS